MGEVTVSLVQAHALTHRSRETIKAALLSGAVLGEAASWGKPSRIDKASLLAWAGLGNEPTGPGDDDAEAAGIVATVAAHYDIPADVLYTTARGEQVAACRQIAITALVLAGYRVAHAARHMRRDHSTAAHAISRVAEFPSWQATAERCAGRERLAHAPVTPPLLAGHLAYAVEDYPPADARAVLAYTRCTLLGHITASGPLCAHGLWLLATQERLYRVVVDRLTRSGYGPDAGRIEGQMARLGYRRSA